MTLILFLNEIDKRMSLCTADPRETAFLYQRVSVEIQRFSAVCFVNTFVSNASWGINANTLRSSTLAVCYCVAEHCCPVSARSSITDLDVQLNSTMRFRGTLCFAPLSWLAIMSNIESINQSITNQFLKWPKWHRHCKDY